MTQSLEMLLKVCDPGCSIPRRLRSCWGFMSQPEVAKVEVAKVREIIIDTETTGLSFVEGDRVVEIACVELIDHVPSGKFYHQYINPEREMPQAAFNIHGLSSDFLKKYPIFCDIVDGFLEFIGSHGSETPAVLIAHNADFDVNFINSELERMCYRSLENSVIDTLQMARKKFPGSPASLDALCRRFNVDLSQRTRHGALLDCELLAKVYLELIGGAQADWVTGLNAGNNISGGDGKTQFKKRNLPVRNFPVNKKEVMNSKNLLDRVVNAQK